MKKTIWVLTLILGIAFGAFCQTSGPMDLVVILDTSASMSGSYQTTSDYLIGPFLREFLRIGDTFHLISFSETPRVEISRRVEGVGDVEAVIGRLLLMYPLDSQSDVAGALRFGESYSSSLPGNRHRKIVLITDGDAANTQNLVNEASARLSGQRADLQYIKMPVTGNGPSSGRPAQAAQASPARPSAQPAAPARPAPQQPPAPAAQTRPGAPPQAQVPPPAAGQAQPQPSASRPPALPPSAAAPQAPSGSSQAPASPQTAAPGGSRPADAAPARPAPQQPAAPAAQTRPGAPPQAQVPPPAAGQTRPPAPAALPAPGTSPQTAAPGASALPPSGSPSASPQAPGSSQAASPSRPGGAPQAGQTPPAGRQDNPPPALPPSAASPQAAGSGPADAAPARPAPQQPAAPAARTPAPQTQNPPSRDAVQASQGSSAFSGGVPLPLIIALALLALLILGLIILFASRNLHNSPNRVMAQAAAPMDNRERIEAERGERLRGVEMMGSYAAAQRNQRKPLPKDQVYDEVPAADEGPLMLNLFVEDQNTAIGRRNIHLVKPGYTFSVGGGKSDFLIFLVPMPPHIADVVFDGRNSSFIPRKPQYFPDIGSQQVSNCIGKTIRVISDKNYELHIRIERYEDPLKALNKMLRSISMPGEVK